MISTTPSLIQYTQNGIDTSFNFPYYYFDKSHLVVTYTLDGEDDVLVQDTHYTVDDDGPSESGGNIVLIQSPVILTVLTIKRVVPITQITSYLPNSAFPAATHETALDRITMVCQQLQEQLNRCLKFPDGEATNMVSTIPSAASRASKVLGFDVSGVIEAQ